MGIGQSILLGVVEGFTEFLPLSSTGHLILLEGFMRIVPSDFVKTFTILVQFGAILAVVVTYWRKFLDWPLLKKLIAAFIPTGIIGLLVYPIERSFFLQSDITVIIALFLGGIVLILFEKYHSQSLAAKDISEMTYRDAVIIGFVQAIAIIPGVSRSGSTVIGGMSLGFTRTAIVEFSFLLAVPTVLAASGLSLFKTAFAFSAGEWLILAIGFLASFLVALVAVRWFLSYIRRHNFTGFGWYRIAVAVIFAAWFFL